MNYWTMSFLHTRLQKVKVFIKKKVFKCFACLNIQEMCIVMWNTSNSSWKKPYILEKEKISVI